MPIGQPYEWGPEAWDPARSAIAQVTSDASGVALDYSADFRLVSTGAAIDLSALNTNTLLTFQMRNDDAANEVKFLLGNATLEGTLNAKDLLPFEMWQFVPVTMKDGAGGAVVTTFLATW